MRRSHSIHSSQSPRQKRLLTVLAAALALCGPSNRALPSGMALPPAVPFADPAAGQALAAQIRSSVPTEDSDIHGLLLIDSKAGHKEIPVDCQVLVHPDSGDWQTIYQTTATNQINAERLVITHGPAQPNVYLYNGEKIAPAATAIPFAGSDFSVGDLGLEFLHWPGQAELKGEMRLGQPCHVLLSTNSPQGGVAAVKSFIDRESGVLLIAEATDTNGVLVKKFSLHGSSFKKVNGQWHLEKMEIQNEITGSHTVLKFDMPKD
jgi:hypothetical protein